VNTEEAPRYLLTRDLFALIGINRTADYKEKSFDPVQHASANNWTQLQQTKFGWDL